MLKRGKIKRTKLIYWKCEFKKQMPIITLHHTPAFQVILVAKLRLILQIWSSWKLLKVHSFTGCHREAGMPERAELSVVWRRHVAQSGWLCTAPTKRTEGQRQSGYWSSVTFCCLEAERCLLLNSKRSAWRVYKYLEERETRNINLIRKHAESKKQTDASYLGTFQSCS